jgi:murein DD-endopeptidase MepM/ murein hydrolase activator NlpD
VPQRSQRPRAAASLALLLALTAVGTAGAQSAVRYRDANGQWVFTDRAPASAAAGGETLNLSSEPSTLHIAIERSDGPDATRLTAVNDCLCVITLHATISESDFAALPVNREYHVTLQPNSRQMLAEVRPAVAAARLRVQWKLALGSPQAAHRPPRPYRAPFAVGSTFTVSQAFPTHITHVTADSQYAVDFALPDGTPVYAAREGLVINVRHDSFRGAPEAAMLDQANVVDILHADGTIGVYGHLHWDSIRVRIGQRVGRGEYIANSGNTGFTTGPHLHFAVWRNTATGDVSVPVQFAGIGDTPVTPSTAASLTAY